MNSIIGYTDSVAFFHAFTQKYKISKAAGFTSTITYAFARLSQIFTRTSDEKLWGLYSKRINDFTFASSNTFNLTFQKVNAGLFLQLSNKKFTSLIKNGAILYFQQKMNKGEETLETINKKFDSTSQSLNELFSKKGIKEICSAIGLEDLVRFIKGSPLQKNWSDFQLVIDRYVESKALRLFEKCQKKFIALFAQQDVEKPTGWKIFLAKQLVDVASEDMPAFARGFLAELKSGLPEGYREKVRLFTAAQSVIVHVVQNKISTVRSRVFEGIPIGILVRPSIDKTEAEFITAVAESCIDFKYTEHFPIKSKRVAGPGFELKYQGDIIIAKTIRDCFQEYKGRISEDDFHKAYKMWNRMEADPKALNLLIEQKIAGLI